MKNFRFAVVVMAVLLLAALGSWTWYFLTAKNERRHARIQIMPPQNMPAPKQRTATPGERQAAAAAIRAQLDAFKKDDYKRAMIYQSKELRKNFDSLEKFREMMRQNYPQFTQYKKVDFGPSLAQGEGKTTNFIMPVLLTGQDGMKVQATYVMVKEDGAYRVAGVLGGASPDAPQENPGDPFSDFDAPPPLET